MVKGLVILISILFFYHTAYAENLQSLTKRDYPDITELDTAINAKFLGSLEKAIILEMNKARTNPQKYAELSIKPMLKRFIGNKYFSNKKTYRTVEGKSAVEECLGYLNNTKPMELLYPDEDLTRAAMDHIRDQGPAGTVGHTGSDQSTPISRVKKYAKRDYIFIGENISYGLNFADEIVSFFLINDGVPSRKHRETLMNPRFNLTGVSCGHHKVYTTMCVIVYGKL